ncbi:ferredoxin [Nocardia sp. CA2R105]|uniref:ferredoxin n=1 Tax=Nocardia coffeae TaxID=2873381 RepID=UPI001CA65834|nr:ferredoxin [Nocardia coffeae]MBY8857060.1 ferredoxin [Nocardia coffeae]
MEIHIDQHRCEGHALCASIAPTVFEVGADDLSTVVDSNPPDDVEPKVRMAVDACPTLAISLGGSGS